MCDFKPGDKVICVDAVSRLGGLVEGREYFVSHVFRPGDMLPIRGCKKRWNSTRNESAVWVLGGADFESGILIAEKTISPGYRHTRFRKVQRRDLQAWLSTTNTIEGPTKAPAKREKAHGC